MKNVGLVYGDAGLTHREWGGGGGVCEGIVGLTCLEFGGYVFGTWGLCMGNVCV